MSEAKENDVTIKDIELRFVARSVPAPQFGEGVVKMVRVLQWRKLIERRDLGGYGPCGVWGQWAEWFDVPFDPAA